MKLYAALAATSLLTTSALGAPPAYHLGMAAPRHAAAPVALAPLSPDPSSVVATDRYGITTLNARSGGTALMVLGIVFTSVHGLAAVLSLASYSAAASYNCSWGREEGRENGRNGETWKKARQDCDEDRDQQMQTSSTLVAVNLAGVVGSLIMLIAGVRMRRGAGAAATPGEPTFNLVYGGDKTFQGVWTVGL